MKNFVKATISVVSYLLVLLFIFAGVQLLVEAYIQTRGMYIEYGYTEIEEDNQGIVVTYGAEATFTINHSEGWGVYKVTDCKVSVIPNTTGYCLFNYSFGGDGWDGSYANLDDVSAGFIEDYLNYDGGGISVESDGSFKLTIGEDFSMEKVLRQVWNKENITLSKDVDVYEHACFILRVQSPDEATTINIPFRVEKAIESTEDSSVEE